MKIYNYLLFRIYSFFSKGNYNERGVHYFITVFSTFIVIISIQTCLYTYEYYFSELEIIKDISKGSVFLIFLIVGFINYFFFVRKNKFLNYNFTEDKKGGVLIIIFLLFLFSILMLMVVKGRDKVLEENERIRIEKLK
ncbi:hypothetical protein SAMN05660845_0587 [Flavobacterium swingsii]|uniref:Uncharacterized protein n=1 Tax=Flavobacterium swingsii TaxID=498292 RepID=A0A1I0W6F6_9FLAO|nr:hypothetical protein [Flavobacterium swingsii]SFA84335.1 hypothetical protein SAMN05660845_0587 [Flavobacterium swingsii]